MIEVDGVEFSWPAAAGAPGFRLRVPSLRLPRGAGLAVYGPSGSGKSTLLDLLAGVRVPARGRVVVGGVEVSALSDAARRAWRLRHVGFLFQDFPLVGHLDAVGNVLLPYRLTDALSLDAAARGRAGELLAQLGLGDKQRARPHQLSIGERQRVGLARALVTEPALLLADEPTTGLDPARRDAVMALLDEVSAARQLTLVLVTHDPALRDRFERVLDVGPLGAPV